MNEPENPAMTINELETVIRSAWQSALSLESIGANDDFILLGGDSLAAAHISMSLSDDLGVEVSILAVFDYPTITSLASFIKTSHFPIDCMP